MSQFADDTNIFLKPEDLNQVSHTLEIAEGNLGLRVNYEKTTIYHIGSLIDSNATFYTLKNFAWDDPPISTLGVTICSNLDDTCTIHLYPIMDEVNNVLSVWQN